MLGTLKLDDRSYEDIREEAIKNIVKHCPEWTNHNASDPGIAIVELFASMTEMLQYRFNRVPSKNYMAFLDMLGISGNFVSPAVSRVQFNLVENFEQGKEKKTTKKIFKGTQFITKDKEVDDRPLIFETIEDTYISNIILKKIISKTYNDDKGMYLYDTHQPYASFTPFKIDNSRIDETIIYLKDNKFSYLLEPNIMTLVFSLDIKNSKEVSDSWFKDIKWEYFNGEIWKSLNTDIDTSDRVQKRYREASNAEHFFVTIQGNNLDLQKSIQTGISDEESYYIRAKVNIEANRWLKDESVKIYELYKEIATVEGGVKPEKLSCNSAMIDLNNRIYPFGEKPQERDIFLIEDKIFSKKDEEITIKFKRDGRSKNLLRLEWEYPIDKHDWVPLKLVDTTDNLRDSGVIKFKIPNTIHKVMLDGEESYAIRAKVLKEDYTQEQKRREEEFYQEAQKDNGDFQKYLNTELDLPYFEDIKISYAQKKEIIESCFIYNNSSFVREIEFDKFKDKDNVKKSFLSESIESDTSLYFGFDSYLQNDYLDLFFDIEVTNIVKEEYPIKWEIYIDKIWRELKVIDDRTQSLSQSEYIRFKIDKDAKIEHLFDMDGMWIRAKFSDIDAPFKFYHNIKSVIQNSTTVYQQETIKNEFVGKSIGIPDMKFKLNNPNIVYAPTLSIGDDIYTPIDRKKRFIDYGSEDKVYKFNGLNAEISFGDNVYGLIPEPKEDIYATKYAISYGEDGNIGKEQLELRTTIKSMDWATNITSATGGADADSLNDLIRRAPEMLRVKNRVVTAKDYESASIDFSPYIIKAKAVPDKDSDIYVFVVTKDILDDGSVKEKILLNKLEQRLKDMSLLTVFPKVLLPKVIDINIKIRLISTLEDGKVRDDFKHQLEDKAREYFDVTKDFPMGKLTISEADLYKILHSISFGYYYKDIKIYRATEQEPDSSTSIEIESDKEIIKLNLFEIED